MNIQWYPGHMTQARRVMEENLKLIDLVAEVLDARCPESSRNPDISRMAQGKLRLFVLTKADLADEEKTAGWLKAFAEEGHTAIALDARDPGCVNLVKKRIVALTREKREKDLKRGIKYRPVRVMIAGIPNVGKSTLINLLCKGKRAKTGNQPGVTRGKQWIALDRDLELLDTPGLLWPRFEHKRTGLHLAFAGSIRDQILDTQELAVLLLQELSADYPERLEERFGIAPGLREEERLSVLAKNRGLLLSGGEPDLKRAAEVMLEEYRSGKLGRITLEDPPCFVS